jgi:glucose/mannose transport system permease protein
MTATVTRNPRSTAPPRQAGHRKDAARWIGPSAHAVKYLLVFLSVILVLMPIYVLLVTSLKSADQVGLTNAWALPTHLDFGPWARAWTALGPSFVRTFELAVPAAIIPSLVGAANGFVLARWRFPGANVVFGLILFGMFLPYQAVIIPLRQVVQDLNLAPGIPTLIFVHAIYGIPICTLIFRNYYLTTVPPELVEAARVDGAGLLRTLRWIVLPVSAPAFVVANIWQFTQVWNDYLFAIFLTNTQNGPITIALNALAGGVSPDYAQSMAGALLASAPPLLVYLLLGRYFIGGLMAGSMKG